MEFNLLSYHPRVTEPLVLTSVFITTLILSALVIITFRSAVTRWKSGHKKFIVLIKHIKRILEKHGFSINFK